MLKLFYLMLFMLVATNLHATYYGSYDKLYTCDGMRFDTGWWMLGGNQAQAIVINRGIGARAINQFRQRHVEAIDFTQTGEYFFKPLFLRSGSSKLSGIYTGGFTNSRTGVTWAYEVKRIGNNQARILITADQEYVTDWVFYNCY